MTKPRHARPFSTATAVLAAAVLFAPLASAPAAFAASAGDDFGFHEPGARAAALGGAFTARSDEVSTMFYNPAGLAFLGGIRLKTNVVSGRRNLTASWPDADRVYRSRELDLQGSFAVSWQPIKRITLGAGYSTPWSYDSLWTPAWSGHTLCNLSLFTAGSLSVNAAIELFKGFAVGGGYRFVTSNLEWQHNLYWNLPNYPVSEDVLVESAHALSGKGGGFTAGVMWKIVPAVSIGASYRESVAVAYEGRNAFNTRSLYYDSVPLPSGGYTFLENLIPWFFVDQDVTAQLTLPREIACGVALAPLERLSLSVDLKWTRWSEFGDWTMASVNENEDLSSIWTQTYVDFYGVATEYGVQGVPLGLADTRAVKAGLEYLVTPHIALRGGYARHRSSVGEANRTPVYPDLDRSVFSFGFGYEGPLFSIWGDGERVSDLSFDLYVRYAAAAAGPSTLPGYEMTYDSSRVVFGLGAGFSF